MLDCTLYGQITNIQGPRDQSESALLAKHMFTYKECDSALCYTQNNIHGG